jgi:hypothetical protein
VGKVYNLCRVKTDISAVLMVKSGLDPHMISKLEDELNYEPCLWFWICLCCICSLSFNVGWYILIQVLIKFDQLKLHIAVSYQSFLAFGLHVI